MSSRRSTRQKKHPITYEVDPDTRHAARILLRHSTLVATIAPLAIFTLRLMAISRGDTAVIAALLSAMTVTQVVVSTVLTLVPILFYVGVLVLAFSGGLQGLGLNNYLRLAIFYPTSFLALWWIAYQPLTNVLFFCLYFFAGMFWWRLGVSRARKSGVNRVRYRIDPIMVWVSVLTVVVSPVALVPVEAVMMTDGRTVVGYVIDRSDPLTVLPAEGGLTYIPFDKVASRQPCVMRSSDPVLPAFRSARTPTCPKAA